ncbi:hypothetical protein [Streptosporangium sp. KLBMP 9127]|nr:hypothetical protein [Streptosporangium sp. KLBMP 9127]
MTGHSSHTHPILLPEDDDLAEHVRRATTRDLVRHRVDTRGFYGILDDLERIEAELAVGRGHDWD